MNKLELKRKAEKLRDLLSHYAVSDVDANSLLNGLPPFIRDALVGKIDTPLEWTDMPGAYFFNEGKLRKYSDLESAYVDFKIEITGGETPVLRKLREEELLCAPFLSPSTDRVI